MKLGNEINQQTRDTKQEIAEFKKSIEAFSDQIDDYMKEFQRIAIEIKDQKEETEKVKEENNQLKREVEAMKMQMEEQAQYGRNRNLLFDGLPEVENENLLRDFIPKLSQALKIQIDPCVDIQAIHRLQANKRNEAKPRVIIVQFTNRLLRDVVLSTGRKLKLQTTNIDPELPPQDLFVSEQLTPYFKKLIYFTKQKKNEKGYHAVWFRTCKVFLRKTSDSNPIIIKKLTDLDAV